MALNIGDNFKYQGRKSNFDRDSFATKAAMKAFPETSIDDGHISYCAEDKRHYVYNSANRIDPVTGKWQELSTGGGASFRVEGDKLIVRGGSVKVEGNKLIVR